MQLLSGASCHKEIISLIHIGVFRKAVDAVHNPYCLEALFSAGREELRDYRKFEVKYVHDFQNN